MEDEVDRAVYGDEAVDGDTDGDGVPELAVGADGDSTGGEWGSGAVYILFLTTDGLVKSAQKISNSYGSLPYALSGYVYFDGSVSAIGDVNE